MLVGNKCDLENERAVSKEDGEQFAEAKWSGLLFVEVSVATTRMLRRWVTNHPPSHPAHNTHKS
ncbi:hypothetical protein SLEP1_g19556 [Rubroshorea leprosula]|uniref:Small monomeric GTPase n=1 Tax=Rubroshorea leprosula TaxID=152421 RepID=A0AAV5JAE4_9ROSI|nr:hypothetical protein SLEP1_g19556 [Rubroshorea leprosula]